MKKVFLKGMIITGILTTTLGIINVVDLNNHQIINDKKNLEKSNSRCNENHIITAKNVDYLGGDITSPNNHKIDKVYNFDSLRKYTYYGHWGVIDPNYGNPIYGYSPWVASTYEATKISDDGVITWKRIEYKHDEDDRYEPTYKGQYDIDYYDGKYKFDNDSYIKDDFTNYTEKTNNKLASKKNYWTSENTYNDIENDLRDSITTKYEAPTSYETTNLKFYTDESKTTEIDKSSKLNSKDIYVELSSTGKDNSIIGESGVIHYEIPFVNMSLDSSEYNAYDTQEENNISDNNSYSKWEWDGSNWNLYTNKPYQLTGNHEDIKSYKIGTLDGVELWSGQDMDVSHNQIKNNKSQQYDKDITITTNEDYIFTFKYHYQADVVDEDFIEIESLNDDIKYQDQKMVLDENHNGEADNNEIYLANSVNTPFKETLNGNKENKYYVWDGNEFKWSKNRLESYRNDDGYINQYGLYAFSSLNEYGNNCFEIVEFSDPNETRNNSLLTAWDLTNETYSHDLDIALSQGISIDQFNNQTFKETRKVDEKASSELMKDLSKISIDEESLELITNGYQSNTIKFDEIKNDLNTEISNQMNKQGFGVDDYEIIWNVDLDSNLVTNDNLNYSIIPGGNWTTSGKYESEFKSQTWNDLSTITIPQITLEEVSNRFEQGEEFKLMRKALESELKTLFGSVGVPSETLNFEWNLNDTDKVYYDTQIEWKVSSSDMTIKGEKIGQFNSGSYFNIRHIDIDENELQLITQGKQDLVFGEIKSELETEINNQLVNQCYPIEWIRIEWSVADETILNIGDEIEFTLSSRNDKYVKNTLKGEFNWGLKPIEKSPNKALITILIVVGVISLIGLILLITIIVFKRIKIKKDKEDEDKNNKMLKNNKRLKELRE